MSVEFLQMLDGPRLAYQYQPATGAGVNQPGVVFLGGFKSDMMGTKAAYLSAQCAGRGQAFLRFDYSGHGQSGGDFNAGTISQWKNEARFMIDQLMPGPLVLVGSSMGGWIALLLAIERPQRFTGLVGIAAAADFTGSLAEQITHDQRQDLETQGYFEIPSLYGEAPYRFTAHLIHDGARNFLLDRDNVLSCPVRLLQGMKDPEVPWQTAFRIKNAIIDGDVEIALVEQGDHRLARPEDLALLDEKIKTLSGLS